MTQTTEPGRIAAIVGRPNVGKSAIFNRLVGRRVAIVHEESGVTRDRLMHEVVWQRERFDLIDTGGIGAPAPRHSPDTIDAAVRRQVDVALDNAAAAMFVVDITAGITPLDRDVAETLRRSGRPVVVAANKADHPERDDEAAVFESLGFPVFPVSALHNRGFGPLMQSLTTALPHAAAAPADPPLKIAVVGRPNVGKSSYINRLLRDERVIVSEVPGTTRDSIDIPFSLGQGRQARRAMLIDTAGLRRTGKIKTSVERFSHFRTEKSIRRADIVILVLDATTGPTAQDKKIAAMVAGHHKGCLIIVNKWDLSELTQRRFGPALYRTMPFMAFCPVVFVSARTGYNIRHTVKAIDHVVAQVATHLPTGLLNRTIARACKKVAAPSINGARLKIFYATQVGTAPVKIRLFVNHPRLVRPAYRDYLVRSLRESFGLEGAPVILDFRSRPRSGA